ncbi:MAG: hypothetical protein LBC92_02210 [Rickettsiales bacterium]|jgi:hypothetical protein|nr:hypothetical protein [Rickettsiales bacterium]
MSLLEKITIIDIILFLIALTIVIAFTFNIKVSIDNHSINKFINQIGEYNTAIISFRSKYGFLPGDALNTKIFDLSLNKSDGNGNGIIEDHNQMNDIKNKKIQFNGEVYNFFIHLYNSGFLKNKNKEIFPYNDIMDTGILVFSKKNINYYHFAIYKAKMNKNIETINNLTPFDAEKIDKKFDDGFPFSGKIQAFGGNYINYKNDIGKNCANDKEYLLFYRQKNCQLIMELGK